MLLQAEKLSKKYGSREVIRDASLSFSAGEIVVLKGRSGSGKSTLLHLLSLLERPDFGQILLNGKSVPSGHAGREKIRRNMFGFLFQDTFLFEDSNAYDNVFLPLALTGKPRYGWKKEAFVLLESVGITGAALELPVRLLSGGERSRIAFIRAIIHKPHLCFCDEPTGNLDAVSAGEVVSLIPRFSNSGTAFVIVTHGDYFDSIATGTLLLENGKLICRGE
ncbi:MAG: ATP-binding cassette domain-containing protein [Candidatus Wallbacteria bacterium]|nr:ATP-binding cassette domain-containing protein [Candidatus Wallbacteria bacterium]